MERRDFRSSMRKAAGIAALSISLAILGSGLSGQAAPGIRLGDYGFEACKGPVPSTLDGKDLAGTERSLNLAGDRLIVLYSFRRPDGGSERPALLSLERLRSDYGGKLIVAAVGSAAPAAMASALKGADLHYPVLSNPRGAEILGLPDKPSFLIIAPGGAPLARRVGAFDWSAPAARRLIDALLESTAAVPVAAAPTSPAVAAPPAAAAAAPAVPPAAAPSYLSPLEAGVVDEVNLARTDPKGYAKLLREYRSLIHNGVYEKPGEIGVELQEGTRAVDDAITFLERQKALPALAPSKGLSAAARAQARDQGKSGATGHSGSDGSSPFTRMNRFGAWSGTAGENISYGAGEARGVVIQLIVDDGVASRGHRANIFSAAFGLIGVGAGPHPGYGTVCVQDFAAEYTEK